MHRTVSFAENHLLNAGLERLLFLFAHLVLLTCLPKTKLTPLFSARIFLEQNKGMLCTVQHQNALAVAQQLPQTQGIQLA
jgi:hypothetical protein